MLEEKPGIFYFIVHRFGMLAALLSILLPFIIIIDVLLRYLFSISFPWLFEIEWQFFGLIFLLGIAQTFLVNKHVRVDLFYHKWNSRKKALIDLTGNIIFLIPFCLIGFYHSFRYAYNSFFILESSPDPGGLPFRFIIKGFIALMFLILLIQAFRNIVILAKRKPTSNG